MSTSDYCGCICCILMGSHVKCGHDPAHDPARER